MPVTTPPATVAMLLLLVAHVPPGMASLSVIDDPLQTEDEPLMPDGAGFTVTITMAGIPATVYEITTVPAEFPVTMPDILTLAITPLLVLHAPPAVASVNVVVDAIHALGDPEMGATEDAFTVTTFVADTVPHPLVTV